MKREHAYNRNPQCVARRPVTVGWEVDSRRGPHGSSPRQVPRSSLSGLRNGALGFKVEHLLPWMGYYLTIKNDFLRALFSNVGKLVNDISWRKAECMQFSHKRTCGSGERETFTFHFKTLIYY